MDQIDVKMQRIELVGPLTHGIEQHHMIGDGITDMGIEPQRHVRHRNQFRARDGIAAGKQCHVMALVDQGFGQVGNDTLGSAIELWRHAFGQWSDLRDFHSVTPSLDLKAATARSR